ncbi:hypothetical protein JTE90_024555 [Oedothorax gibbosus]|uniref:Uncharacterized protein n=1 Tax=Oedothorax gibbosus TaxID=931172 RepID=A0AAV6VF12_9ARAC|nr:hypothetical protein JTE90_024555 [Oedothorax gibbosus]
MPHPLPSHNDATPLRNLVLTDPLTNKSLLPFDQMARFGHDEKDTPPGQRQVSGQTCQFGLRIPWTSKETKKVMVLGLA